MFLSSPVCLFTPCLCEFIHALVPLLTRNRLKRLQLCPVRSISPTIRTSPIKDKIGHRE